MQYAAVRKLGHELGIPEAQLPLDAFRYLTRLHYCAADTGTYGPSAEWGEHEVRQRSHVSLFASYIFWKSVHVRSGRHVLSRTEQLLKGLA